MRLLIFLLVLAGHSTVEARPGDTSKSETLIGWSDDGRYHAVITLHVDHGAGDAPEELALEVREGAKLVATFGRHDPALSRWQKGLFVPGRVNLERWRPLRKYGLKRLKPTARAAFQRSFALRAERDPRWPKHCAKQWSMVRKGDEAIVGTGRVNLGDCVAVLGGFVHAKAGKALVKLTISTCVSDLDHGDSGECLWIRNKRFVAVANEEIAMP